MENNEEKEKTQPEDKEEQTPETTPTDDTGEGQPIPDEPKSKIEEAEELAERIEKGNKAFAENINKLEKMKADDMLSGKSFAGQAPVKEAEQTPEDYAKDLFGGKIVMENEKA